MIGFANADTTPLVRSMWKTCFGDSESYMDLYFSRKYRSQNTLLYFVENSPVASLQMLEYNMKFYGKTIPIYYLAGLCTLPEYRSKGYMGKLINEAYKVMFRRNIPIAILVPAEASLFDYYSRYNFIQTFDSNKTPILLESYIKESSNNIDTAFTQFDKKYQQQDFTVLKNKTDFETILDENKMDNYAPKYNLAAMASIIKPMDVLNIFANTQPFLNLEIDLFDNWAKERLSISIQNGKATTKKDSDNLHPERIKLDTKELTKLLFGYKTYEISENYTDLFKEHKPIINLMLE